jgi:NAD(P)H-hydrate epimerase
MTDTPTRLTRDQTRRVDRIAVERLGLPSIVLMENAALNAASFVIDLLQRDEEHLGPDPRIAILCGGGNNGGDGYALARHLHNFGLSVTCYAVSDPAKLDGDAKINHDADAALGFDIVPVLDDEAEDRATADWKLAALVVDAMLGTGFRGEVRPRMAGIIHALNQLDHPRVLALDTPTGLDCETGQPSNATVRATATITFVAEKIGFAEDAAQDYLGEVVIADIGLPLDWAHDIATEQL